MTNEKASVIIGNIPVYGDECYSIAEYQEAKTVAVQALSQEPILDKIRAEISDFEEQSFHRPNTDYSDYAAIRHCLEIIDKYKEENEPKGWLIGDAEHGMIYKCFCPKCGKGLLDFVSGSEMWWIVEKDLPKFCPYCGSENKA